MILRSILAALAACLLIPAAPATAQSAPSPLFASDDPIKLTIQAPLPQLMRNREFRGSVPGVVIEPGGQRVAAEFELRGLTRRTVEVCDFPPIRVDFPTPPPATSLFAGQNKLKLVTHCRSNAGFQQNVLLELAAYRMYNQLTPRSMRVRLANIDYVDADGRPIVSRVGFFLEDITQVARRNGLGEIRARERIPTTYLNPVDAGRYALFQHMLANHDWSMRAGPPGAYCCHNANLVGTLAPGQVTPIAYDFDFSGFVNAPYATPPDELGLSSVRQRQYRGYCIHGAQALAAAAEFRARKPQIIGVLAGIPGLEPRTRASATAFLDRFFAEIATEGAAAKALRRCIG